MEVVTIIFQELTELIAIFARVQGLQTVASHVAEQLMEENRSFRSRWLRVLQNG